MRIKVTWRDIKKFLPLNCPLGQFLSLLCQFIKTYLGEEHMQRLWEVGFWKAFIRDPNQTKEMRDDVQSEHPKTLSCSFVVMTASKRANVPIIFRDMMEEVMECLPHTLPLHLKIAA